MFNKKAFGRRVALRHGKRPEDLLEVILEKELALLDKIN